MTFRLAIFDFDGTLADSWPVFADTLNGLAARHGFRPSDAEQQAKLRGMSAMEVLRELRIPLWKVPAVLADARAAMAERIGEVKPFAGVADALNALMDRDGERRIAVAVATSNAPENVRDVLGEALVARFAAMECGASLFGKTQRLRTILRATGVEAAQAIYVGDELRDAEAAESLGMKFGAVSWGYTTADALAAAKPHAVFHTPADWLAP